MIKVAQHPTKLSATGFLTWMARHRGWSGIIVWRRRARAGASYCLDGHRVLCPANNRTKQKQSCWGKTPELRLGECWKKKRGMQMSFYPALGNEVQTVIGIQFRYLFFIYTSVWIGYKEYICWTHMDRILYLIVYSQSVSQTHTQFTKQEFILLSQIFAHYRHLCISLPPYVKGQYWMWFLILSGKKEMIVH